MVARNVIYPGSRRLAALCVIALAATSLAGCSTVGGMLGGPAKKKQEIAGERVSILTFEKELAVDPRLDSVEVTVPPPEANADWPQPGGNASHTLANLQGPSELHRIWRVGVGPDAPKGARQTSVPIVAQGKIFVLNTQVQVSAHNAKTGKGVWRTDLATKPEKAVVGFGGGLAFDEGRLIVATGFGDIFALNPEDGSILWRRRIDTPFRSAPTATEGRIFVSSNDNELFVLDASDGRVMWTHKAFSEGARILSSSSPAVAGDAVVAPFSSGELVSFLQQNGRVTWSDSLTRTGRFTSLSTLNDIAGPPVIDQGWVYAVSHSGRMVAIDLRSGQRIWSQEIASIEMPWIAGDFIYLVSTEGQLMSIYRRDGGVKWLTQLKSHKDKAKKKPIVWSGPVLYSGKLLLLSSNGRAVVASPIDGSVIHEFKIPGPTFVRPIVAEGIVYVLTNDGELVAYGDEALRKDARPSRAKLRHEAEPMDDEKVKSDRPFWQMRTPEWVPIVM